MNLMSDQDAVKPHKCTSVTKALVPVTPAETRIRTLEKQCGIVELIGNDEYYLSALKKCNPTSPAGYISQNNGGFKPYKFKALNISSPTDASCLLPDVFKQYRCPKKQKSLSTNRESRRISLAQKRLNFMDKNIDCDSSAKGLLFQVKESLPVLLHDFKELTFDDKQTHMSDHKSKVTKTLELNLSKDIPPDFGSYHYLSEINAPIPNECQSIQDQRIKNILPPNEVKDFHDQFDPKPATGSCVTAKRSLHQDIERHFDRFPPQPKKCRVSAKGHSPSTKEILSHQFQSINLEYQGSAKMESSSEDFDSFHRIDLVIRHSSSSDEAKAKLIDQFQSVNFKCKDFDKMESSSGNSDSFHSMHFVTRHSSSSDRTKEKFFHPFQSINLECEDSVKKESSEDSDSFRPIHFAKRRYKRSSIGKTKELFSKLFQIKTNKNRDSDKERSSSDESSNLLEEFRSIRKLKRRNSCPCSEDVEQAVTHNRKRQKLNFAALDNSELWVLKKRRKSDGSE